MFSSEQIFSVNGDSNEALSKVLQLALDLNGSNIEAFYRDKNGLVFCKYQCNGSTSYPFKPTVKVLVEHIQQYINELSSEDVVRLAGEEPDNDGTVRLGWEVFHPLWYGVNQIDKYELSAIIGVRPSWIVYGK